MKGFFTQLKIQALCDLRNRSVMFSTYFLPIVYYVLNALSANNSNDTEFVILNCSILTISIMAYSLMPGKFVGYRSSSMMDTYRVSGIPVWSYHLIAVILGLIHNMIMICGIILTAPKFFNATSPENVLFFLFVMLVAILTSMSLGLFVSSFIKQSNLLSICTVLLLLPSLISTDGLPESIAYVFNMFPAKLAYFAIYDKSFVPILLMILETFIFLGLFILLMKKITRKK